MRKLGNWLLGLFRKKKCCEGVCKGHKAKRAPEPEKTPEPEKAPKPPKKQKMYNGWDNFGE